MVLLVNLYFVLSQSLTEIIRTNKLDAELAL